MSDDVTCSLLNVCDNEIPPVPSIESPFPTIQTPPTHLETPPTTLEPLATTIIKPSSNYDSEISRAYRALSNVEGIYYN